MHPELGLDLPRTQSAVLEVLDGLDLRLATGTALTSVVADLDTGRPGPTILLRGDMDALPMPEDTGLRVLLGGRGPHARLRPRCPHSHAGRRGAGAGADADALCGRVRFMFQPGEEGYGGAAIMIDEGVLEGVDAAFALHVAPNLATGQRRSAGRVRCSLRPTTS